MTKDNIDTRLEAIESKLDCLASSPYPMMGGQLSSSRDDEIDLRELWGVIWQSKWIVVATVFVFAVASVFYALSLPNIYKSEALLAPAEANSGGGLAGLAGQFGGLASLAGVSLGGGSDKTTLAIEILKSRDFISKFIRRHDLLVPLIAAKGWDSGRNELLLDEDIYSLDEKRWIRDVSPPQKSEPSEQEAFAVFEKIIDISQDKKTDFVTVSVKYYSPDYAKRIVDWLVEDVNEELKERDVTEAKRSISFLEEQLGKTSVADMQTIFFQLIEEQTKIIMFAEVRDQYVFKTIDPPVIPEMRSSPKRALVVIIGTFLGGVIGVVGVLMFAFVVSDSRVSTLARERVLSLK